MVKFEGPTVQAAVAQGLKKLGISEAAAKIEVIQTERTSFLIWRRRPAVVEITSQPVAVQPTSAGGSSIKVNAVQPPSSERVAADLASYLEQVTRGLGATSTVAFSQRHHRILYVLTTDHEGLLIGKHGRILNALQVLAQTYYRDHSTRPIQVIVDVGDYRQRRAQTLAQLAERTAHQVIADHQAIYLDPMPALERKVIHETLAHNRYVDTRSEGHEPKRFVVIALKRHAEIKNF